MTAPISETKIIVATYPHDRFQRFSFVKTIKANGGLVISDRLSDAGWVYVLAGPINREIADRISAAVCSDL